ncbi:unnamed protein product [Scytosiphon promiscuus]
MLRSCVGQENFRGHEGEPKDNSCPQEEGNSNVWNPLPNFGTTTLICPSGILVDEMNFQPKGKGPIFPSADFYQFVCVLEVVFRHAMLNPVLLATFLGDFPSELKRAASTAEPINAAWPRYVDLTKDPLPAEAGGKRCLQECNELFNYLSMK